MPNIPQNASPAASKLIIGAEAIKLSTYLCPDNILTIGVGHKLLPKFDWQLFSMDAKHLGTIIQECQSRRKVTTEATALLRINKDQAMTLLSEDIAQVVLFIRSTTRADLNQNQLDALTSFIFNIGQGNYATSSTRKALQNGIYDTAAEAMALWNKGHDAHGNKITLPGLVTRRAAEIALFNTPS